MAKWGKCDYKQLQKLQQNLEKMMKSDTKKFYEECAKELAARLLSYVIPATPVGDYRQDVLITAKRDSKNHKKGEQYTKKVNLSGKVGGTLRRGWTSKTQSEAENGSGAPTGADGASWANSLKVQKNGNMFIVEVINPVEYASYVEYGHRQEPGKYIPAIGKRLKVSWVNGKYFLTKSEKRVESITPRVLESKILQFLEENFNGG